MSGYAHRSSDGTIVDAELFEQLGVLCIELDPSQARAAQEALEAAEMFHDQSMAEKLSLDMRSRGGCQGYYPSSQAERAHLREQRSYTDVFSEGSGGRHEVLEDGDDDVGRTYEALDLSVSRMTSASTRSMRSLFVRESMIGLPETVIEAVEGYHAMCRSLVDDVVKLSEDRGLLEPAYISSRSAAPMSQIRLLKYPPASMGGLNAHTDYELASVCVASAPGLEVFDGESWLELDLTNDQACFMAGDLMEIATGGRVPAALHRVRTTIVERVAAIYFAGLDYDRTVPAPLGGQGPSQPPVHVGEHLGAMTIRNYRHLQQRVLEGRLHLTSAVPASNPLRTDPGGDVPLIACQDFIYY